MDANRFTHFCFPNQIDAKWKLNRKVLRKSEFCLSLMMIIWSALMRSSGILTQFDLVRSWLQIGLGGMGCKLWGAFDSMEKFPNTAIKTLLSMLPIKARKSKWRASNHRESEIKSRLGGKRASHSPHFNRIQSFNSSVSKASLEEKVSIWLRFGLGLRDACGNLSHC